LHPVCTNSLDCIAPTMGNSCAQECNVVHAGKEDGFTYQDGSTQDCVVAASPRAPASNTGDRTISGSFKEPVALSGRGTKLHSAMAPIDKVEDLTMDHPGSVGTSAWDVQDGDLQLAFRLRDKTVASALDPEPLPSQDELPRLRLGNRQGLRNGAEVIQNEKNAKTRVAVKPIQENPITSGAVPFVEIVLELRGKERRFTIFNRPLGAECSGHSSGPTKICKVHAGSYASKVGVEVGWALKSVDGEDMRKKTFQQTQDAITVGLMRCNFNERRHPMFNYMPVILTNAGMNGAGMNFYD